MSGRAYTFDKVCSCLVKEPYNLPFSEIGNLTPYQVKHIFFRAESDDWESPYSRERVPLDEEEHKGDLSRGVLFPEADPYKSLFYRVHLHSGGLSLKEVGDKWGEYCSQNDLDPHTGKAKKKNK